MFRIALSLLLAGFVPMTPHSFAVESDPVPADKGKRRIVPLFAAAAKPISASVVRILADRKEVALGTVVSADGYILTKGSELRGNNAVRLADGTELPAVRIGYHKPSDLALLKVEKSDFIPVIFRDDDPAEIGNWIAAVGTGPEPISVGVVSVKARKLYFDQKMILNADSGYMGIQMKDAEEEGEGVVIDKVVNDSPAAKALLKPRDTILAVDGKAIKDRTQLLDMLAEFRVGDTVSVSIQRGEDKLTLKVKLAARSAGMQADVQNLMGGTLSGRRTGFPLVIQHDTILNPKDCGGPLVDLDGRVLGINIARAGRVETWTIPGKTIRPILAELLAAKPNDGK